MLNYRKIRAELLKRYEKDVTVKFYAANDAAYIFLVEIYRDIENLADILGVSEQQLVRAALRLYFKPYKDQGEEIRDGWRD